MKDDNQKIMILASSAHSLDSFRGDLIKDLIKNKFDVFAAAPNIDTSIRTILESYGAKVVEIKMQRTGMNPFKDLETIFSIKKALKENQINILFPYTIKPVIFGSFAARMLNTPTFSLITGLGYTFSAVSLKSKILQQFSQLLYKMSLKKNKVVIFQNNDDHQLFLDNNVMTKKQPFAIVSGSGVNLNKYKFRENINRGEKTIFIFVARLMIEKGIDLYLDAAKQLKNKYKNAEFHILGNIVKNSSSSIDENKLTEYNNKGYVIYHGVKSNVQDYLTQSDVFVLPTFYREGIPRSSLEALSIGMPLIITDSPGCKETIKKGKEENGILIETKSLKSLSSAMEFFIKNPVKIATMGINSRSYAEKRFDVKIVNEFLINLIKNNIKV